MPQDTPSKQITLNLTDFIDILLRCGIVQHATPKQSVALNIKACDPEERFVHVETIPADPASGRQTELYRVWGIEAWRISLDKEQKLKEQSELRRQATYKRDELVKKLREGLCSSMGMHEDSDGPLISMMVSKLFKSKNTIAIKELSGIDISVQEIEETDWTRI